ncbi:alpha/beta fold hydrolase [Solwaraspora sp. WMMD1047]|uniref:thioesterase II family protein n=1 Tax=Solwaraspora sp. WMMD1047 TaxID=3016102 RepID=UPI002415C1BC|nr:alpha/beta fold hydrolase [Solwaraspora sp. WMMD1047]MDG4830641.1 alpha/beta fold hydrolase [Solwaraspora sp. WMMD1047]
MRGPMDFGGWVRRYRQEDPRGERDAVRLVCFPHAGAGASCFFPLARILPSEIGVLGVQYPGRQDRYREPCIESIPLLADRIHEALLPLLDRPFALFGHSMGGLLAFEVARRCESDGNARPSWVCVSGRRAPSTHRDEWIHLEDDAGLVREMLTVGGTDRRLIEDPDLLTLMLSAVRSDYRAVETYSITAGPPLTCPMTVLTGKDDPKVTVSEAQEWAAFTTGGFTLRVFPGGHFFIDDCRAEVAGVITDALRSSRLDYAG